MSRLDRLVPLKNKSIVKKTIDGVGCVVVVSVDVSVSGALNVKLFTVVAAIVVPLYVPLNVTIFAFVIVSVVPVNELAVANVTIPALVIVNAEFNKKLSKNWNV